MKFPWRRIGIVAALAFAAAALSYVLMSSNRVLPRNNSFTMWVTFLNAPALLLTPFDGKGLTRVWSIFAVTSFVQWGLVFWFAPGLVRRWRRGPEKSSATPKESRAWVLYRYGNVVFVVLTAISLMLVAFSGYTGQPAGMLGVLMNTLFNTGVGFYGAWVLGFLVGAFSKFFAGGERLRLYCAAVPFWFGAMHLVLWVPTFFLIVKRP